jgi:hypothetical protein
VLSFAVTGTTDGAGTGTTGPDGAYVFNMADYGLGVAPASNITVLALVGVFLDNSTPTGATEPSGLDFSGGYDFTTLSPGLAQIFFIGNGLTSTATVQQFIVPVGATRLFLGTVDGFQWNNNTGDYRVTVTDAGGSVPEPGSWAMMLAGAGLIGTILRRRARVPQTY